MPTRIRRRSSAVLGVILIACLAPSLARAQAVPRVRLVATGGTISNRNGGRLTAEDLVQSMPGTERYARPELALTRTSDPAEIQRMFAEY